MNTHRSVLALATSGLLACGGSSAVFPNDEPADTQSADTLRADGSDDTGPISGEDSGFDATSPVDSGSDATGVDTAVVDTGPPKPCTATGTECGPAEFCDAPTCDKGLCQPRPVVVAPFEPACGCDGVTYYSAAYAGSLGRSSRPKSGECSLIARKGCGVFPCPHPDDVCVHQLDTSFSCGVPAATGVCWGMPKDPVCPSGGKGAYSVCGGATCIDQCDAIKSAKPFFVACK
jgi:hypothetical protein